MTGMLTIYDLVETMEFKGYSVTLMENELQTFQLVFCLLLYKANLAI